jgi:hypothetical protein
MVSVLSEEMFEEMNVIVAGYPGRTYTIIKS